MIYVGIDDTDTLDDPGTNKLAQHLVQELAGLVRGRMIVRHQLLSDRRVPCTNKNGCASILFSAVSDEGSQAEITCESLLNTLRPLIQSWCSVGSDPGLCVTESVPSAIVDWGRRCQRDLVTQAEARELAQQHAIHLEGLGGTEDGVIGALAAVGLMATRNDGRVVYFAGADNEDWCDISGCVEIGDIHSRGVDEVCTLNGQSVTHGIVEVGKQLRPNYHNGRVVLYVARRIDEVWEALRVP